VFREAEAKCVILLEDRRTRLCATLMRVSDVDVYPRLSLSLCLPVHVDAYCAVVGVWRASASGRRRRTAGGAHTKKRS
jgi:hypothetical protein